MTAWLSGEGKVMGSWLLKGHTFYRCPHLRLSSNGDSPSNHQPCYDIIPWTLNMRWTWVPYLYWWLSLFQYHIFTFFHIVMSPVSCSIDGLILYCPYLVYILSFLVMSSFFSSSLPSDSYCCCYALYPDQCWSLIPLCFLLSFFCFIFIFLYLA